MSRASKRKLKTIYDKYSHENFFKVKILLLMINSSFSSILKSKFRLPKAWNPSHLSQTTPSKWTWASPNRILNSSLQLNYIITTDKARYKCSTTQPVSPLCMCKSESRRKKWSKFWRRDINSLYILCVLFCIPKTYFLYEILLDVKTALLSSSRLQSLTRISQQQLLSDNCQFFWPTVAKSGWQLSGNKCSFGEEGNLL